MITVLLVDDDESLLELTRLFLEKDGFYVVTANSKEEALTSLQKGSFDVIVSDYEMPGMDGLSLLVQIRSSGKRIPFIIFTGRDRDEVAIRALNEGADFYIRRGGDPKSQFAELNNAIRRSVALRESERRMSALIDTIPDPTFTIDKNGVIITWNRAMEDLTGVPSDEMIGRGEYAYAVPIYGIPRPMLIDIAAGRIADPDSDRQYTNFHREGDAVYGESSVAGLNGILVVLWEKAIPVFDDDGRPSGAVETIRDISYRTAPENELQLQKEPPSVVNEESGAQIDENIAKDQMMEDLIFCNNEQKQLFDTILDHFSVNLYVYDRDCRFRYVCRKGAEEIGMTVEEMIGHHWRELNMPPEIMETIEKNVRSVFDTGEEIVGETSYATPDGLHHFRYTLTPMSGSEGIDLVLSTSIDITDVREAEDRLIEQDALCHILFESAGDALLIYDGDLIIDCNQRAAELFGLRRQELIGRHAGSISPQRQPNGDLSSVKVRVLLEQVRSGELKLFEWQGIRSDGTLLNLEVTLNRLMSEGRPVALAVIRDISDRKREDKELKEALIQEVSILRDVSRKEKYLEKLLTALPGMVYQCDNDHDWTMRYVSEGVYNLTGYRSEDLIGNQVISFNDLILPDHRERIWKRWEAVLAGKGIFEGEYPIRRRDDAIRWVWERGYGIFNDDGTVLMLEGFITDVTDRRTAEESLRHVNEKLNLLSSITRHDVKNRLGTILGYLDLMEGPDPVVHPDEAALRIRDAVTRILRMINFTRDYQEIGSHGLSWQNLRLLVSQGIDSLETGDCRIELDLPPVEIMADPLFERVIGNCIENAVWHGEGVTTIRISATRQDGGFTIVCEDDGCGIPIRDKERIFDRGFGKNTGLGLFLAREILTISGISITEEGTPGEGAKFVISVPDELVRSNA